MSSKTDDAGLIAASCRHDIVLRVFNVVGTGERQQYAHLLLRNIMEDNSCPDKVFILYDISCSFSKYLETRMPPEAYGRLTFGVSIVHAYAHAYSCQVLYSPRTITCISL